MREIKFRAWDKKHKLMQALSNIFKPMSEDMQTYINHDEGICHLFIGHGAFVGIEHPSDIVLMQYTGLKDKNGKEIYEGDIVEFQDDSSPDDNGEYGMIRDVVVYNSLTAQFMINSKKAYIGLEYSKNFMEVIGNIYENPNLLSENK
jgi:uncharacterized phage protein (TIGR01671 family)